MFYDTNSKPDAKNAAASLRSRPEINLWASRYTSFIADRILSKAVHHPFALKLFSHAGFTL